MTDQVRKQTGHAPAISRGSDGENCRYCSAWSDADWAKPCLATAEHRAAVDRLYAETEDDE